MDASDGALVGRGVGRMGHGAHIVVAVVPHDTHGARGEEKKGEEVEERKAREDCTT